MIPDDLRQIIESHTVSIWNRPTAILYHFSSCIQSPQAQWLGCRTEVDESELASLHQDQ